MLDEKTVRFGFRTVQFVAGGLYLNGQRVELRGLDRHQSYPYQGYAMPGQHPAAGRPATEKGTGLQRRAHLLCAPQPGVSGRLR